MDQLNDILPIIMYILGIVLLVTVIILVLKLIKTVDKTNILLDDLEEKSRSLDNLFYCVDSITDTIASVNDKVIDGLAGFFGKIFKRKSRKEEEDEYE